MDTAFVTGATGFTGREVVRELTVRRIRTIAHVRPDSARLPEWTQRFESLGAEVDTSPWDRSVLTESLREAAPTHVFCLIGTTRKRGKQALRDTGAADTYETVDYGLTALLVEATLAAGITPRFVYLSGMGTSARALGAYGKWRWQAEEVVRHSGLPYTICRASFIVGAGGEQRDEPRTGEHVGSRLVDGLLDRVARAGLGTVRDRYASHTNAELGAALVRVAFDLNTENRVVEADELRDRSGPG